MKIFHKLDYTDYGVSLEIDPRAFENMDQVKEYNIYLGVNFKIDDDEHPKISEGSISLKYNEVLKLNKYLDVWLTEFIPEIENK